MKSPVIKVPEFGKRLREARISAGLTQQDLADDLGITLRNYQRYEYGDTEPSLSSLVTISISLNTSVDHLLGLSDEASSDGRRADPPSHPIR